MSLRVRLLLTFSTVALSALTFFGFIAYDMATETSKDKDVALIRQIFLRDLDDITRAILDGTDVSRRLTEITRDNHQQVAVAVIDDAENVHYATQASRPLARLLTAATKDRKNGQFIENGFSYTWFRHDIPERKLAVALIYEAEQAAAFSFLRQMGVSLAFTALIVVWVAAWAAVYVSTLIEKLRDQKNILQFRALHDSLTSLPNRTMLREELQKTISDASRDKSRFALCFIDLNRFKEVNDTLGHQYGDELLIEVARRLKAVVRTSDIVARLGGDEFAILLRGAEASSCEVILNKLSSTLEQVIELNKNNCFVSSSIGIALYPADGSDLQSLLRNADLAMYCAKKNGLRHQFFENSMLSTAQPNKLGIAAELREAINNKAITVHYQPKLDISTQKILGIEALARWEHPTRGFVPPTEFVEVAERAGLITPLTYLIIEIAFRDQVDLIRKGHQLTISINLSSFNLRDPNFIKQVSKLKRHYGVDPSRFIFELTESAVISNSTQIAETLSELVKLGFVTSIDDFGTGYSSFVNLKRLPIREIKIDRSFIMNLLQDTDDAAIVHATIALGRSLGLRVVAEGVETEEVLSLVKEYGCHEAQGYHISKPIPLQGLVRWIQQFQTGSHNIETDQPTAQPEDLSHGKNVALLQTYRSMRPPND